jgi:hypothetical protein
MQHHLATLANRSLAYEPYHVVDTVSTGYFSLVCHTLELDFTDPAYTPSMAHDLLPHPHVRPLTLHHILL